MFFSPNFNFLENFKNLIINKTFLRVDEMQKEIDEQ